MKIVNIPHPTLREKAKVVEKNTKEFSSFLSKMKEMLANASNPKGVGLAAPQVDSLYRVFLTLIEDEQKEPQEFINPKISDHSEKKAFGPDPENPRLEGCLSMPGLYGPVPRWEWVEVDFQKVENGEFVSDKKKFSGFHARVIQHELDHLDGILFTDYSLQYDLPVYIEKGKELVEITDRKALELY
jgi:peptide deformylase